MVWTELWTIGAGYRGTGSGCVTEVIGVINIVAQLLPMTRPRETARIVHLEIQPSKRRREAENV